MTDSSGGAMPHRLVVSRFIPWVVLMLCLELTACSHWRDSYFDDGVGVLTQSDIKEKLGKPHIVKDPLLSDKTTWTYSDGRTFPATSVPLFDSRCGRVVSGHLSKGQIDDFLRNLWTFKPRQFILESFTLNQAAGKYMECFND